MLPNDATPHSQMLLSKAQTFLSRCPKSLYDEAAVTGSVSRGVADKHSDIELNFWTADLQAIQVYVDWVEALPDQKHEGRPGWYMGDESLHLEYTIGGVKFDLIWQSWGELERLLAPLCEGKYPSESTVPWMLYHAIPLGDTSHLHTLKECVATYPDALRDSVINPILHIWRRMMRVPHIFFAQPMAERGQLLDLRRRQVMGINALLTVLFAFNRQWEPDFKWIHSESTRLLHMPTNLLQRINALLMSDDPAVIVGDVASLIRDTLHIIRVDYEVDDLLTAVDIWVSD